MDAASLVGVRPSRIARVTKKYTVPGALTQAVASYEYKNALKRRQVLDVANTAFERDYQNALSNPYHVQQATGVYNVGIIEHQPGLGDTDWGDIVKTFVGEVGKGVGGWISGDNPYITQQPQQPQKPAETPTWVKAAVIGGGALLGTALIVAVLKR